MTSLATASGPDASSIAALLRDAAAGHVPDRDLEVAQNPVKWATDWSRTLIEAGGGAALGDAVGRLLASGQPAEVELARAVQGATKVAAPAALWSALRAQVDAGRADAATLVAQAAAQTHAAQPGAPVALDAYALALDPATPDEARAFIMRTLGRADPDWILANPDWLLHADAEIARRRVADALGGLHSSRMAEQFDRLSAIATARGTPFAPAVAETMAAMVKARSAAGM